MSYGCYDVIIAMQIVIITSFQGIDGLKKVCGYGTCLAAVLNTFLSV